MKETQKQFKSKQMVKHLYGIPHRYLIAICKKSRGFANIVSKLETRLDVLVYRLQFANSIAEARDFIKKGYISVNYKPVYYSGFFVDNGSSISCSHVTSAFNRASFSRGRFSMPRFLFHTSYLSGVRVYNPRNIIPSTESPISPHFKFFNNSIRPRSST